jgi:hypothetical protein
MLRSFRSQSRLIRSLPKFNSNVGLNSINRSLSTVPEPREQMHYDVLCVGKIFYKLFL